MENYGDAVVAQSFGIHLLQTMNTPSFEQAPDEKGRQWKKNMELIQKLVCSVRIFDVQILQNGQIHV